MILADAQIAPSTLSVIVGYLAQYTRVCAMLIDAEGRIAAVNRAGLALIEQDASEVCGKDWLTLCEGGDRARAAAAVAACFEGHATRFAASLIATGRHGPWQVEAVPCDWVGGNVARILLLSTPATGPADDAEAALKSRDAAAALAQTLHTIANLSTAAISAANILRRGVTPERAEALAQSLEESGQAAARAMGDLKALVGAEPPAA